MKLYTIGYEGTNIARFVEALARAGVKTLVDVRALPLSRKKGFSKGSLAKRLSREGIQYVHFPELGTPKAGRVAARAGRRKEFRRICALQLKTEAAKAALAELRQHATKAPTCLMCLERDPAQCHRSMILRALGARVVGRHLFPDPG
ncbi:MAG TPA: DUF488 domain-containing protein [Xanthobacteraceae bacterium]|nr:DUF488 domain-containing protein [Xanthobacteraceae bacterium]